MALRKVQFAPGEHYHIYGRGVNKQTIFFDKWDYARFLFLILYYQSPAVIHNIGRAVNNFIKCDSFEVSKKTVENIAQDRYVELVSFALMPNHFHLLVCETEEGGISEYMQRVLTAYAKYFNAKYEKTGHVFQGPFQAVHIETNEQLIYLSAYIHRNPRELKKWNNKEHTYPWSSYQDYIKENRWGELLKNNIIVEQFNNPKEYRDFTETSGAKEKKDKISTLLID